MKFLTGKNLERILAESQGNQDIQIGFLLMQNRFAGNYLCKPRIGSFKLIISKFDNYKMNVP
jgi:hypothetical protein